MENMASMAQNSVSSPVHSTFSSFDGDLDQTTAANKKTINSPLKNINNDWSAPSPKAAFYDGISTQTTIQSAMVRERNFITSKKVQPYKGSVTNVGPGVGCTDTIWGTIQIAPKAPPSAPSPKGLRPEVLKSFESCFDDMETMEPSYAIGHQSSVSFKMSSDTLNNGERAQPDISSIFIPQAYRKHLGIEPQNPPTTGPAIMVSDRAPDSVVERRRRRELHKHIVSSGKKIPFNRKALQGSLSDYAEERMVLSKLTGDCHQPGDPKDIGPPRVKLWLNPRDNDHVTYVKSDPRYGRGRLNRTFEDIDTSSSPLSPNINYDQVRPRTVGYSPGNLRSIRKGASTPVMSSTARRVQYCNELHGAQAEINKQKKSLRKNKNSGSNNFATLSDEVEIGIGIFEEKLNELKAKGWKGV